jgi:hypothetical protein
MTNKESELLDDIEAWRKANIVKSSERFYLEMPGGDALSLARVGYTNSGRARLDKEPEMLSAIEKVMDAIAGLEPARAAIVERKMRELRELT